MDVKMATPLLSALRAAQAGSGAGAALGAAGAGAGAGVGAVAKASGTQFTQVLDQALQGVSGAQAHAAHLQREFQLGNESVSLEATVMAMQQSQIAFQAALTVRNRLVSAYTDIMNMPV